MSSASFADVSSTCSSPHLCSSRTESYDSLPSDRPDERSPRNPLPCPPSALKFTQSDGILMNFTTKQIQKKKEKQQSRSTASSLAADLEVSTEETMTTTTTITTTTDSKEEGSTSTSLDSDDEAIIHSHNLVINRSTRRRKSETASSESKPDTLPTHPSLTGSSSGMPLEVPRPMSFAQTFVCSPQSSSGLSTNSVTSPSPIISHSKISSTSLVTNSNSSTSPLDTSSLSSYSSSMLREPTSQSSTPIKLRLSSKPMPTLQVNLALSAGSQVLLFTWPTFFFS